MSMVNITIDGKAVQVPAGTTVLEAAKKAGIDIPTLCYLKDVNEIGACRMCLVEIKGARALQAACVYPVAEGNEILTTSPAVKEARKVNLELLLSNHKKECLTCVRNKKCELQTLSEELNIKDLRFEGETCELPIDDSSVSIVKDHQKCILCRRCVAACKNIQKIGVIDAINRGFDTSIGPAFGQNLADVACVNCGQCVIACPVGALTEKNVVDDVWAAIADPEKVVLVQTAPAVRAAIGESFDMPIGTAATSQMVGAMLRLGFDKVFDTDTGADLTILEEGTELINRINNGGKLPLITSCSPGWIKYCEHYYPEFLDNLSSCKSPHEMFGAILKTYYAEKESIDPKKIVTVSVMPCTAKKFEAARPEMANGDLQDVDYVLTTRELAQMIKEARIDFNQCEGEFEDPFGPASGAGVIFGATGGVMEAALRTVADVLTGKDIQEIEYTAVRGVEGVKEASVDLGNGTVIKAAVAHGLGNARELLEKIKAGEADYHFVEIMACPGGCVNGGGQPIQPASVKNWIDLRTERAKALYDEDKRLPIRKSHKNLVVMDKIYGEYLGEPGGEKAHHLLHTTYTKRERF
ncbi:MAG: 2Fe-2S iron-sulfur cluster binding domain-containing protein [Firmicutes bacterium]|nr:2Fe-2S iron-sulfur cluster binding domain-containing protein [Bacillota bacterium]